jgi:phytoene dehydrogenase-like protein
MAEAVVVGSGPNGLVAAITLARAGWSVRVLEAADEPGGGMRSAELTLPGFIHDVCSTVQPLALGSPALRALPLADHGLEWVHPDVALAHPLDDGRAALLHRSVGDTAAGLGVDARAYRRLVDPHLRAGFDLTDGLLSPFRIPPRHPVALARFGLVGLAPADWLARRWFEDQPAQAMFAGLAAHSILSLRAPVTTGYGLVLGLLAHLVGWPIVRGGSVRLGDALIAELEAHGGRVECDQRVTDLGDLRSAGAVLLDMSPHQALELSGVRFPDRYRRRLAGYRLGAGVHKVDWALDGPIPWTAPEVARAGTVHLGGTRAEITAAEGQVASGSHPERPFVLLVQHSLFDPERVPAGKHSAWAYCHVPNGSTVDMTERIEAQVERFAPGFRDRILARSVLGTAALEAHNPNYRGGDINGGAADLRQFVARPTLGLRPWRTPVEGIYLCSASTPPGGGVHGMCGWHAAQTVLHDAGRSTAGLGRSARR